MKILPQVFPMSNVLTTNSHTKNSHALFEGCLGKSLCLLPHPLYGSVISIWCCLDKMLALILLFSRHLDWIWTVEGLRFSFLPIRSRVLWFVCLPVTEWQLGRGLGCFYLVPHLIPGRPFCLCVMSQVTLIGKAIVLSAKTGSQPWESRNWHASWSQWTKLQPWPIFSWKSIRWPYFP